MSKPIPGQLYKVQIGDTLERIASIAYGDISYVRDISLANQAKQIVPGVILYLPLEIIPRINPQTDFTPQKPVIPQVTTDGLVLNVGGLEIPTESLRFFESIENVVDGWTAVIAWTPGQKPELDAIVRPYSYADAYIFLDRELLGTGRLYGTSPGLKGRQELLLECWSLTADFMDSALKPPYEENNVTLKQRAETLSRPFPLLVDFTLGQDGIFDRVTANAEQTAGAHLLDLAKQRGALVSSTAEGALLISIPDFNSAPVGTIEEGIAGFSGFEATFDGRVRFSDYRMIGDTPSDDPNNAISKDEAVPIPRFKTKTVNETTLGEMQRAADWEKTKFLAEALSLPILATGFKAPNGKRWKKGSQVILISPTLFINDGFTMLIKSVEFSDDNKGEITTLNLVPPSVYSGGDIVEPWA